MDDPKVSRASITKGDLRSCLVLVVAAALLRATFFGGLVVHDDLAYVVTREPAVASFMVSKGDIRPIAVFRVPITLRTRLLSNPTILDLLSQGRDEYRMSSLRAGIPPLELYRISSNGFQVGNDSKISRRSDWFYVRLTG